ncbi:hypothetical protein H0H81_010157 [Sphagnurus paluster]|uniref:Uncharacterized protein n=1 Tax=Sphagnurus paluster TaxID=117069 RepID=A0A9P7KIL9_9AGAR|nr:hypothetical protein H0H81_010157 [Sphagnurus paluster]
MKQRFTSKDDSASILIRAPRIEKRPEIRKRDGASEMEIYKALDFKGLVDIAVKDENDKRQKKAEVGGDDRKTRRGGGRGQRGRQARGGRDMAKRGGRAGPSGMGGRGGAGPSRNLYSITTDHRAYCKP